VAEPTDGDRVARAVGLEVTCERYVQTLVRVRRVRRAAWLAARLGPLAGAVPGTDRRTVAVAGGDASEVLGKLWTAGERYRRLHESLDGAGSRVDPGGDCSAAAFVDLRRRLTAAPDRARAGDYAAVAAAMADADRAIRSLREAHADDCAALAGFDAERLRAAAAEAAGEMNAAYRARRAGRTTTEAEEPPDQTGSRDEVEAPERRAEAGDDRAEEEPVAADDGGAANAGGPEGGGGQTTPEDDEEAAVGSEAVIGSSFDIDVSGGSEARDHTTTPADSRATADDEGEGAAADEEPPGSDDDGGFRFGVATEPPEDDETG
jgi:hypothetical protein